MNAYIIYIGYTLFRKKFQTMYIYVSLTVRYKNCMPDKSSTRTRHISITGKLINIIFLKFYMHRQLL